jgi:NADH dehydrogenase
VASALLSPAEIAHPVRALLRRLRNVEFREASVVGFDLGRRLVRTDRGELEYDYLVLASGSVNNYFGNRSLEQRSLNLKHLPDALTLRNHVLEQFELSEWADADERRRRRTFAVVGGGPTGVEFAGALHELVHVVLRKDYRRLEEPSPRVVLVEAADEILAGFDPRLRLAARRSLAAKGVEVWTGVPVQGIADGRLQLGGGRSLEAGTVVWTAGVRADDLTGRVTSKTARQGRLPVTETLQVRERSEVFAIGDVAAFEQDGEPLPMLIPVAMQEAKAAARSIRNLASGVQPVAFRYRDPGMMATIGRNSAVAQIGRVRLSGFPGWLTWLAVHLVNIVSLRSRLIVLLNWAWDYVFYDRPIRLILAAAETGEPAVTRTRRTPRRFSSRS